MDVAGTTQGPVSNAGAINCITIDNSTITGNVTNTNTGRLVAVTGLLPFTSANGINIVNGSSVSGSVANAGSITANSNGILVVDATVSGGITNAGTISAVSNAGIFVHVVSTFSGGITNNGAITDYSGIRIDTVSTFLGGITNSGTISAANIGILVNNALVSGGITNAGTISAGNLGIVVSAASAFTGGIANSGTISAATGIYLYNTTSTSSFLGGITNSGTISASGRGIFIAPTTFTTVSLATFGGGITNTGTISAGATAIRVFGVSTFVGGISNGGTISAGANGNGIFVTQIAQFGNPSTGGGIVNTGAISANNGIIAFNVGTFAGGISNSGTIAAITYAIDVAADPTFLGGITNSGTLSGSGGVWVGGLSTFGGGIVNTGRISGGVFGILVSGVTQFGSTSAGGGITNSGTITATSGAGIALHTLFTLAFAGNISNAGTIIGRTGISINAGVTFAAGDGIVNSGTITGTGGTAIDLTNATSPVTIDILAGAINGNIAGDGGDTINFNLAAGNTFTYADSFTNINQVNINSGTVVLNGAGNTATTVDVNSGGTLAGTGVIISPNVAINSGGTFAPGTPGSIGTFNVAGNLTFNPGSSYAVQIASTSSSATQIAVTGTATLNGGTVVVTPKLGNYNEIYQIITTPNPANRIGTFSGLTINGNHSGTWALDYTTNPGDVDIDIAGASLLSTPAGTGGNQQNTINGINNGIIYIPPNTPLPQQFQNLGNLSGPALLNALTQLDGEAATDAEKGAFVLMDQFLGLMLDPFVYGRGDGTGGGANGFAPEQGSILPPEVAQAYASLLKAPPAPANFDRRWSAWGSAFGGANRTDGNLAAGSNNVTAEAYGFAAGMDYHVTPDTLYGFALAGGGTNWGLAQRLGSGRSDALQVGVYGKTHAGPAYLFGALAFANHWFTTDRIALGDQLQGKFTGQNYSGRLETGYRFGLPASTGLTAGVSPYAAVQAQDFHTPSYSETDLSGGGFGLSYNAMNATDIRSELGARFDDLTLLYGMPLILRSRLAWAHDWVSNPVLGAVFETLPGSNITVSGATAPKNSALTTAAAELHMTANWALVGKFDGQFGAGSQTYGGTGTLRYSW